MIKGGILVVGGELISDSGIRKTLSAEEVARLYGLEISSVRLLSEFEPVPKGRWIILSVRPNNDYQTHIEKLKIK